MEDKLKLLQKGLKNKKAPYIYLTNNKLYATTGGDLGVYKVEDSSDKMWDINTLEEVLCNFEFPKLEYVEPMINLCKDEFEVDRKELINVLKRIKECIKDNKEYIDDKDICYIEITKNDELMFKIPTKSDIKYFGINLPRKHILYQEFRDIYLWDNIYKYAKLCKGKTIKVKYNSNTKGSPLIFEDGKIYKYVTMPCVWK